MMFKNTATVLCFIQNIIIIDTKQLTQKYLCTSTAFSRTLDGRSQEFYLKFCRVVDGKKFKNT